MRFAAHIMATAACLSVCSPSMAAFPFVENFTADNADWRGTSAALDSPVHFPSGGQSGGYISQAATLPTYAPPGMFGPAAQVVFRASHSPYNSSNSAYTGNWLTAGIKEVTAYLRHNSSEPLFFDFRFAAPGGTSGNPGASYRSQAVPAGNAWTQVTIDVTPTSAQLLPGGYGSLNGNPNAHSLIFDDIGHIQISAESHPSFASPQALSFNLDRVTVGVPEPAAIGLAGFGLAMVALVRRRRRR